MKISIIAQSNDSSKPTTINVSSILAAPSTTLEEVVTNSPKNGEGKNSNKLYNCNSFKLFLTNLQSVNGRLGSLEATVKALDIDIGILNETNLKGKKKLEVDGYMCFNGNRKKLKYGRCSHNG